MKNIFYTCLCFVKIDNFEYCAAIKLFVLGGLTPKEIHLKLTKVYRNSANLILTIKKWAVEFKCDRSKMTHVKDSQKLLPHWKLLKRCTILCWATGE